MNLCFKILGVVVFILLIFTMFVECFNELDTNLVGKFTQNTIDPKKFHIFMAFDEKYGELMGNNTAKINKLYCEKYGFNFHKMNLKIDKNKNITYFKNKKSYKAVPHYGRYLALSELIEKYPKDHVFMYIDSDAALLNHKVDITKWIPYDKDVYILFGNEFHDSFYIRYSSFIRNIVNGITFNSGVFIARNNQWVKNFLDNILYGELCNWNRTKKYIYYDQQCISNLINSNSNKEKKYIKVIPFKNPIQNNDESKIYSKIPIYHTAGEKINYYYKTIEPTLRPDL
jgi:hypothetical protein